MSPTTIDSKQMYLALMKKTLSYSLWPEPPLPLSTFRSGRSFPKKQLLDMVTYVLGLAKLQVVQNREVNDQAKKGGYWSVAADTMIGTVGLDNIQDCVESVLKDNIQGDLIETGVWRGGACIFMRAILAAYGVTDKCVFVVDSFQGLPKPNETDFPSDKGDNLWTNKFLAVSKQSVQDNFRKYDLLDEQVIFIEGWFKDTLPTLTQKKFSVIRLDGDMYESTWEVLTCLYPRLSDGGYCIIDDYHLAGCKAAVDNFRQQNHITNPIKTTQGYPIFWRK